jgi:hypothetical protein
MKMNGIFMCGSAHIDDGDETINFISEKKERGKMLNINTKLIKF